MAAEAKQQETKQTILVTGANKGIGLALCQMLVANKDNQVILACRNFNYVPQAKKDNAKKQPDNYEVVDGKNESSQTRIQILQNIKFKDVKNIDFVEIDVSDKDSVNKAAQQIKEKYKTIDILVNNAGIAFKGNAFDIDVVNTTLTTNYFGTVNVTEAFLPLIKEGGRVIFTSSRAGVLNNVIKDKKIQQQLLKKDLKQQELEAILTDFKGEVEKDKTLQNSTKFKKSAYGMSKVAMSSYSRIVASSVNDKKIFVAAYCPGYCQTYMSSGGGDRTPSNGAKGLQLLCEQQKSLDETGKFWGVTFVGGDKDKNIGKLENYSW